MFTARDNWRSAAGLAWPVLLPLVPELRSATGALLVGFCWLAVILFSEKQSVTRNDALDAGLLALSAWVVLGLCWACHPATTLGAIWRIGPGVLAFLAARRYASSREHTLLKGLALVAGVLAGGALLELAGRTLRLLPPPPHWQAIGRAHWPLTNPDHLAYLLEGLAPFAFLAYARQPSAARLVNALLLMTTLAATFSASAPLALVVVAIVLGCAPIVDSGASDRATHAPAHRVRRFTAVALAVAVMVPFWWQGARAVLTGGDPAGERLQIWRAGLQAWLERPFTGFGFGCFGQAMSPHQNWLERVDYTYAHSCLVEWPVTTGIVGALLALFCLVGWWRRIDWAAWQTRAVAAGCGVMLLHECFDFGLLETAGSCWFGFLAGMAVARDTEARPATVKRAWWTSSLAPAVMVLLAVISGVICMFRSARDAALVPAGNRQDALLCRAAQDPRNSAPMLAAADQALKRGDNVEAERLARLTLARQPGLAQARLTLAAALQRLGRRDAARQTLRPLEVFYAAELPLAEKQEAKDELARLAALRRALTE